MSVTDESQPVRPQGMETRNRGQRPKWVVAAVIWFGLIGLVGGWNSVQTIGQMSQLDWASAARRVGVEEGLLKQMATTQVSITCAVSLGMLAAGIGMWAMKKWGAFIGLILVALIVIGLMVTQSQRTLDLADFISSGLIVAIGAGQLNLWRKGELT